MSYNSQGNCRIESRRAEESFNQTRSSHTRARSEGQNHRRRFESSAGGETLNFHVKVTDITTAEAR
jgi:hypothetical protein